MNTSITKRNTDISHKNHQVGRHNSSFRLLAVVATTVVIALLIVTSSSFSPYTALIIPAAYAAPGDFDFIIDRNKMISQGSGTCMHTAENKPAGTVPMTVAKANSTDGRIYVLYQDIHCIDVYEADGTTHVKSFGNWCDLYKANKQETKRFTHDCDIGSGPNVGAGEFNWPRDMTVDKYGRVIVADTGNARIQVFDSEGNYLFQFGTHLSYSDPRHGYGRLPLASDYPEDQPGRFTAPWSVAVDNKNERIIVGNAENVKLEAEHFDYQNVQMYHFNGTFIKMKGTFGSVNEDDNGRELTSNERFYDADHQYHFNQTRAVGVHPEDSRIFVADRSNLRVQVYDSELSYLDTIAVISDSCRYHALWDRVHGIEFDSYGRMYFTVNLSHRIYVLDYPYGTSYSQGTYPELLAEITGSSSYVSAYHFSSEQLGSIYVGDYIQKPDRLAIDHQNNNRILVANDEQKTDPKFLAVTAFEGLPAPGTPEMEELERMLPCKLISDGDEQAAITDYSIKDDWDTYGINGTVSFPQHLGITHPAGFAFNSTGHMFVANANGDGEDSRIFVFDPTGNHTYTTVPGENPPGSNKYSHPDYYTGNPGWPDWDDTKYNFFNPQKIAIDSDDNVYVANTQYSAIMVYDPNMNFTNVIPRNETGTNVYGIAADPDNGKLYFADPSKAVVHVFDPDVMSKNVGCPDPHPITSGSSWCVERLDIVGGNDDGQFTVTSQTTPAGDNGPKQGQFQINIADVAVHPHDNRLIVADTGNQRVQVFDHDGNWLHTINMVGDSPLTGPRSVTVDPTTGNIVFTDMGIYERGLISESSDGRIIIIDSDSYEPVGIISYLTNSTGHAFEKLDQIAIHPVTGQIYAAFNSPPSDHDSGSVIAMINPGINPNYDPSSPSSPSTTTSTFAKKGGGSNDFEYLTAPTFGLSHDSRSSTSRLIDSGISLNGFTLDVDSFHTEFAKQILQTGQDNILSAKVKTSSNSYGGLKIIEFFYGVPEIGAIGSAEGSIEVHLNPYDKDEFPEITNVVMRNNNNDEHSLLSQNDTTVAVQRVDCIAGDAKQECYKIDIDFVFANSPVGEVFALQATDSRGWSTTEYFNDGFEVQGIPLIPVIQYIAADLLRGGSLIEIHQVDRKDDLWLSSEDNSTLYTKNEFGFWKKLTPDKPVNRCQDDSEYDTKKWTVMNRMHCLHDAQLESEIKKAQAIFNSSAIQKELPSSSSPFAHEFPLVDHRTKLLHNLGYLTTDDVMERLNIPDEDLQLQNQVVQALLLDDDNDNGNDDDNNTDNDNNNSNKNDIHYAVQLYDDAADDTTANAITARQDSDVVDAIDVTTLVTPGMSTVEIYKFNSEIASLKEQLDKQSSTLSEIQIMLTDLRDDLRGQQQELDKSEYKIDSLLQDKRSDQNKSEQLLWYVYLSLIGGGLIMFFCFFYFKIYTQNNKVRGWFAAIQYRYLGKKNIATHV